MNGGSILPPSLTLAELAWPRVYASLVADRRPPVPRDGSAFVTHHVPPFTAARMTPTGERLEQAACGAFIAGDLVAPAETAPTCRLCRIATED